MKSKGTVELARIKHQEEKLKELGYEEISTPALYMYGEYKKEIEHLGCTLHIFIDEERKIKTWFVKSEYLISTQGQIDNLQIAFNILKSDLKELGYDK